MQGIFAKFVNLSIQARIESDRISPAKMTQALEFLEFPGNSQVWPFWPLPTPFRRQKSQNAETDPK